MSPFTHDRLKLKTVSLLLGLCHAGSAAALGLGEISVRSYLGQPLDATVSLLGAPPGTPASCFSLDASPGSIVPPPRAQLSIEQSGGQTLLHIRSSQSINEPVAQFVLISDCEARLQREYVVLLDPAEHAAPATRHDAAADAPAIAQTPAAPLPRTTRPRHHANRASTATARAPVAAPRQPARHAQTARAAAPRLVLSGKHSTRPAAPSFALRSDSNLPDLTQPRPDRLTATEMSDENTALTRKLADLEAQLAALQKRNAALEARAAAPVATPPPAEQPVRWPLYLLAVGLLGAGGAWAARLRRNRRSVFPEQAPSTAAETPAMTLAEMTQATDDIPGAPQRMPEIAPPPYTEGTEVKEDILDQAEVFMAHGHGDLAVHLLQEHLRAAPTESPVPWLLLLDLLHREGDTAGYAAASAECRRYFNVNLSGHPISQDSEQSQGLEAYPHLLEQMVKVWNTPEIDAFFHDLIYDNRGGTRMGFEPGAYRDILLLREIAHSGLALAA